jgi:hypothetical protein
LHRTETRCIALRVVARHRDRFKQGAQAFALSGDRFAIRQHFILPAGDSIARYRAAFTKEEATINISAFVALDRSAADRPDCVVTFSSPFDLSDQKTDDFHDNAAYMQGVRNYIGTDNRDTARAASPISKIDSGTAADFRPMFMVQADGDTICPPRQIFDMVCALDSFGVDPCHYVVKYVTDSQEHAFGLWNHQDPDWQTTHSIGESVLTFLHDNLD